MAPRSTPPRSTRHVAVRRRLTPVHLLAALALVLSATTALFTVSSSPLSAVPVASDETTYEAFGRVFPDPHGCVSGQEGTSPWAKGQVCATQYAQWDETLAGLRFLEDRFGRYLQVQNLRTMFGQHPEFADQVFQSAGLPKADLTRDKRDLYVIKVTDRESPIPEPERKHFAYSLSIHGIERAGLEGGVRSIEDLVTWAACEDGMSAPACTTEGPFPKRILEPSDSGPTAGEVLRNAVVYYVFSNPDGWHRGELTEGGVSFQRYNGNGMDLNRDWPSIGYTEAAYTPVSEPETKGFAAYLKWVAGRTTSKRFAGAIDLHGMLDAPSFSFTLLGAGQRDYRKNAVTVDTSIKTFRDSEARLSWSPLIAPAEECPGDPANLPMCSDQWGTVWDTINYQVTGSFGDWMDSSLGLDAVGIDNEMALSHLAPNTVFDPQIEQLHIDGNKGLIYSQISSLLFEEPVAFTPQGRVGYVADPTRITDPGGDTPTGDVSHLPTQDDIEHTNLTGIQEFAFDVHGTDQGVHNGGMAIEMTFGNLDAVSPNTAATIVLEYCGPPEHAGDPEGCREVARYFNQSFLYLQAGARIDLNDPRPGPYRIRPNAASVLPTKFHVSFSPGESYPQTQQPYDVSRMDFFTDLNRYVPQGSELVALSAADLVKKPKALAKLDTLVVANRFLPGTFSEAQRAKYAENLRAWVASGGDLVLTDAAVAGLPELGVPLSSDQISGGFFYAGWMDFNDGQAPTYAAHPLAAGVDKEGTAEGSATIGGQSFQNRHQTYEPVPLGYVVSSGGSGNASCTSDRCDSPNWVVDQDAWTAAGGTIAARTLVRRTTEPGSPTVTGVSLGDLPLGSGRIRIAGALLPDPTEENHHPFGLASYALTYTGYQVFENLVDPTR